MTVHFVRSDVLRNVQQRLIESYGGLPEIRDENALESAVARPQNLAFYNQETSIPPLAAALSWALLRNHPFIDGNKRIAFAAILIFYGRNSYELMCSEVEETAMTLRAAAGTISEEDWPQWLQSVSAPRSTAGS